jgi:subtilase-type serine protease
MPGASLGFVVDATGNTGALTVTGDKTADFNNGTIVVIPTAGKYEKTTMYEKVLTADDIVNPWTNVTANAAFLKPYLVSTEPASGYQYDLVLNRLSFSTGALNSSFSLGTALDGMYDDATGDMRTILDELVIVSPGEAQTALAELGGGTHTAFQFMSFYGINKYHGALNNHLGGGSGFAGGSGKGMAYNQNGYPPGVQTAIAGGGNTMSDVAPILLAMAGNGGQLASGTNWDIWIDGYFSQGNRRSDDVIAKYKQTLYGALMGLDYRATDNLLIGISAGLSQAEVKFDELMDKGNQDSYQGSVYAYYDGKPWYAEGVLTYAYNTYKMDRFINVGGITRLANSEYKGNEYAGYAEVGYKLDAGGIVVIQPLAAFQAVYLMQDGYTETGAGDLNLIVDSQDTGSYQSYLGLRISKAITMGKFVLTPDARAKWAHEFSSDDHLINAKFSSAGSGSFTVEADRPSRDTAIVGVGLTGRFNKNLSMYIQYDAELNRDYTNHTGMLGLRFSW